MAGGKRRWDLARALRAPHERGPAHDDDPHGGESNGIADAAQLRRAWLFGRRLAAHRCARGSELGRDRRLEGARRIWSATGTPYGGYFPEPGGAHFAVGLGFVGGSEDKGDVYLVGPDGASVAIPSGSRAVLRY
ncbi:MAG TPA: hypothetical protein VIN69_01155 [Candidatus Limnocylindria bacterium]